MEILQGKDIEIISECREINTELFNKFISYLDVSAKTVETYSKSLKQLSNYFRREGIISPTRENIIAYKEYLASSGHKATTIQNYIAAAKIFFRWAKQEGLYENIADHIKSMKLDRGHKKDYLTREQLKEILANINRKDERGKRDYAILTLMATCGLRDIEISRADIKDLGSVGENTVLYIQGKGKQEKSEYVKISPVVEKILREYLIVRTKIKDSDPLFISTSNNSKGLRLSTRSVSGIVKTRFKNAGYNTKRLTAHSLRHTAVTLALLAGKNITEVQQFARHANITTTMIYNHSLDCAKNSCSEAIAQMIF